MAVTTCKAAQNCTRLLWHPQGCWYFQSAHLPVHTELPLLPACSLVSVPLFFTNKEPLTSLNIYPSYAALQEYAIAQVVLFQVQEFSSVSQNWVILVFMVCKCKACVCASSVTGMPVPNIWGFTWGSLLKGSVFFTACWQLYSVFPVVLPSVWFAFLVQQLFMSAPCFFPASLKSAHMLMILCH